MAPTERLTLRATSMNCTRSPLSMAGTAFGDQHVSSSAFSKPVLLLSRPGSAAHRLARWGWRRQAAEVEATGLPVLDALAHVEQVGTANQVVELADAQLGHDLTHFFCDEEEVVHDMLGLARELLCAAPGLGWPHRPGRCSGGTCAS